MQHRGGQLTAADLPRLERNYKALGQTIRKLKKEIGLTDIGAIAFWDSYAQAVANISATKTEIGNFREDFQVMEHRALVEDHKFAEAAEVRRQIAKRLRRARVHATYGNRWRVMAKPAETVLVRLPASVCKYVGPRGGTIRYNRDQRLPAAKFWPGGQIPSVKGIEFAPPAPPKSTWEGQHPLLVQLQEAREWHEANQDNIREMRKVHYAMDYDANARRHARDRIVHDICERAESLDYWQDPNRETLREAA